MQKPLPQPWEVEEREEVVFSDGHVWAFLPGSPPATGLSSVGRAFVSHHQVQSSAKVASSAVRSCYFPDPSLDVPPFGALV